MRYRIRFNKTRGQPGRGSFDHVWRVFDETGKEWVCKNIIIDPHSFGEKEKDSDEWNIVCYGRIEIKKETSTIVINQIL
jgi:hypothetical protein